MQCLCSERNARVRAVALPVRMRHVQLVREPLGTHLCSMAMHAGRSISDGTLSRHLCAEALYFLKGGGGARCTFGLLFMEQPAVWKSGDAARKVRFHFCFADMA